EGERAEYLALLAVSEACAGRSSTALRLADEAEATGQTIEALVLVPACRAIVSTIAGAADAPQLTMFAFRRALNLTNLDSFVVAYRACPALIAHLASDDDVRPLLEDLLNRARDTKLARSHSLTADPARPALLSPREREVLGMVAQGLTNREIAAALFISEATAKLHVHHILDKLGVRTRTEAALKAASTGDL